MRLAGARQQLGRGGRRLVCWSWASRFKIRAGAGQYRSINANAARLGSSVATGAPVPVIYFDWQPEGSSFYLPAQQCAYCPKTNGRRATDRGPQRPGVLITRLCHIDKVQTGLGQTG